MRIGVIFPQLEIGADPGVIRAYAQTADGLGYNHLLIYDHVLGADVTDRPGWRGYTQADQFHEPFVLFGFLAAVAPHLELVTDVIILPQRQTALVAKQAAEVDILTGGKLRLGVGSGLIPASITRSHRPSKVIDGAVQRARSSAICSSERSPRLPNSLSSPSYSTAFQPTPTPSRSRPPLRTSTSAACLATRAVCRCGRITTPVTSSSEVVSPAR